MKGTSFSQTVAMDLMPPRITTAVSRVMATPVIQRGAPILVRAIWEMALAWTMHPMPKAHSREAANTNQRAFIPRSGHTSATGHLP
jgi:hypothetical protein